MPILLYDLECHFLPKSDIKFLDFVVTRFWWRYGGQQTMMLCTTSVSIFCVHTTYLAIC